MQKYKGSRVYLRKTVQEGWSRAALINAIEADFYHRTGGAITNFEEHLPLAQSKLAKEITKENYDLGFISLLWDMMRRSLKMHLKEISRNSYWN